MNKPFNLESVVFEVITEDGTTSATLRQLHENDGLLARIGRQSIPPAGRSTVFLGRQIVTFPTELLRHDKKRAALFREAQRLYESNPLKYYMPPSNDILEMLNWRSDALDNTMKVLHAGVGVGKSTAGWIDVLLSIVDCDSRWPIFTDFGVKHRKYRGALETGGVAVISYELKNHENTIWPQVIRRWTPEHLIADYKTGRKSIQWRFSPRIDVGGTPVFFLVSSQKDTAFVSQALDIMWWDEQSTEDKFNNANARVRRRGGRHVMTMTPHHIQGRADTGAGSYVDRIRKGEMDVALDVKFFCAGIDSIVNWVMPKEDKRRLRIEWEESPIQTGNRKKLAEGRAILYGEFHEVSGLVFDDWDRSIHVIEPFEVPKTWTFFRYHDHGRKEPNAAILVAVSPDEVYYIVAEYYERDKEISENAAEIIQRMTGNSIAVDETGRKYERFDNIRVVATISDIGSLNKSLDNARRTIRDEYLMAGLVLQPGSKLAPKEMVPMAAELLRVNPDAKHVVTGKNGAPRLYVFSTCTNFIREIERYRMKRSRIIQGSVLVAQDRPADEDDHLMRCLMELAVHSPRHIPDSDLIDKEVWSLYSAIGDCIQETCSITGY